MSDSIVIYNGIMALFSLLMILGQPHIAPRAPQLTQDELWVPGLVLTPTFTSDYVYGAPEPATDDLVIYRSDVPGHMTWSEIWVQLNCDNLPYNTEDSTICT